MLEIVKSKSMIGVMLLILVVSYLGAIQTIHMEENENDNLIVMLEV